MPRRLDRAAAPWILTIVLLSLSLDASAKAPILSDTQRIKQLQRQILLREPMERREALERRVKEVRKSRKSRKSPSGARARRPGAAPSDLARTLARNDLFASARTAALMAAQTPTNVLMNDTTGEESGVCQSEISMASHGNNVVAVWNDGIGIYQSPTGDVLGYAYSTDGGATWTDGGAPPNTGIGTWASDPVVVVNEKTGEFYFSGLADQPQAATNSVAVVKGSFGSNGTFSWGTPVQVMTVPNALALLDKEWIAVDSLSGNVYCSYSYFAGNSDEIRFQRSVTGGQSWGSAITLSSNADAGLVQGSRPCVGPGGEVYVVWHAIGPSNSNLGIGPDYLRVRRSDNFGVSFASETTPASLFSNFGSGGPGFNRGLGITFPGIAVDRGTGPHRGRVYVSWSEAVNFPNDYYPRPGIDPAYSEVENNNGAAIANHFTPGEIVRGVVSLTTDLDYFQWDAVQGTTYVFWVDSLASNLDASLRVFCTDATNPSDVPDNLAFSQNGSGGEDLIVFTAPTTGAYFLRIASYAQANTGKYRIRTTVHDPSLPGRARDHRDVFICSSDNGVSWSTPVRANDSPGYFDDFLPEVAVDGRGHVFVDSYDWRDAVSWCGGGSNAYLYESTDGGATFGAGMRLSDITTRWSNVYSTLIPNQGDYIALFARDSVVFAGWADARGFQGDPNAFTARLGSICAGAPISLLGIQNFGDSLVITWSAPSGMGVELFRRDGAGSFVDLGPLTADASGHIVYSDTAVELGHTYTYRLATTGFCLPFAGEVTTTIAPPQGPPLTLLNAWPNPARPDDLNVSFVLDGTLRPATIALVDITGREVKRITMVGQGPYVVSLLQGVTVPPGMYYVRLTQGGVTRSRQISIFP